MINIFSGEHMGEIFYNGISLNDLDMPQIRRQKVSYVEQHPTMFNISVQNYLHFGVDDSELVGYNQSILLKMFELEYLLDKEINENGSNLSGGEKQKLSIVRSLSKDSSLILLDEPTSALDQKSITTLIEYLELRKQQAIIVIVSHDSRILSSCDELVEMRWILDMENQNAFNEEEYSALRAETCTRIEIMNSQATSALTTALATWVMGFTLLGFQVTSQPTDIMAVLLPLGQIVAFLATILLLLPMATKSGENLQQMVSLGAYIRIFYDEASQVNFSAESAKFYWETVDKK